jgi:hypothetical protein
MTPHYRLKKLTAYPEWHKKPLLLNRAEMANPYTVLTEFFDRYDLSQIRVSLQQWLNDALDGREAEAASHFYTHENIAKMVEAAWVIFEQRKQIKADEGFEEVIEEGENEEPEETDNENMPRFVKWVTFPASLKITPIAYMKRVFEIMELEGLEAIIYRWQKIALTAAHERYDEAGERADLMDYCEGLHRLLEAAYILQRHREWDAEGRVRWQLSEEIKYDLLTEEHTFILSEEEITNPNQVIGSFFETFAPPYARRELWDMLGCVVECKQQGLQKLDLLLDYECLHAVLEAAWLFCNQLGEQMQKNEEDKTENP